MSKPIEPLPCPFCGRLPTVLKWHGGGPRKTMVMCEMDAGCHSNPSVVGYSRAAAVRRWNMRTD